MLQRTTCILVRQHDDFVRIDDLRRFRHEMNTAEDDHIGIGFLSLVGKAQGIAHKVGHFLDLTNLIIMSQNDRVAFLFETENILLKINRHDAGT